MIFPGRSISTFLPRACSGVQPKSFTPVSLMLSLRTMLSPQAAGDFKAKIQLHMNGEPYFWARNKKGEVRIGRGEIEGADLTIRGSPSEIAGYVYAGLPLSSLDVEGDLKLAQRLPGFFPMPEKAQRSAA